MFLLARVREGVRLLFFKEQSLRSQVSGLRAQVSGLRALGSGLRALGLGSSGERGAGLVVVVVISGK